MKPTRSRVSKTITYIISVLFVSCIGVVHANENSNIAVVTAIEKNDPFTGQKSKHIFWWKQGKQSFYTGTTDITFPGGKIYKVKSVRNNFESWRNSDGVFLKGSTKSGITAGLGPGIDYRFRFTGGPTSARVTGCHDGYPSYKIYDNNKLIYYYQHRKYNLIKLFGSCDIKVDVRYTYPE